MPEHAKDYLRRLGFVLSLDDMEPWIRSRNDRMSAHGEFYDHRDKDGMGCVYAVQAVGSAGTGRTSRPPAPALRKSSAFYRNLKLDARTRDEFVHLIETITIANSIKPTTANLDDGEHVHEIMVLDVRLKGDVQPKRAIEAIAAANPHKLVLRTEPAGTTYVLRKGLRSSATLDQLTLTGKTLDDAWDSICAQVIFGDRDGAAVDARIDLAKRRAELEIEIAKLDTACRKAKQINRRNELFKILRQKKSELDALGTSEG